MFVGLVAAQYCSSSKNEVCYTLSKVGGQLQVKIDSKINGWAGFGVGSNMIGDIVVAWPVGNKVIISDRTGTGKQLPDTNEKAKMKVISSTASSSGFSVTFTRPLTASLGFTQAAVTSYMAAYKTGSISSTDPNYSFSQHTYKQNFAYDLESGKASSSASTSIYSQIHGYLMIIAWLVLVPLAVLVARFGKTRLGHKWYLIHRGLNSLAFLLTTVALALICIGKRNVVFTPTNFIHPLVGSIVYGATVIQIGFGWYINKVWNPNRGSKIPWHDYVHWVLGYILLIGGLFNGILGIKLAGESTWYIYTGIGIFGFTFLVFVSLQLRLGQIHHTQHEREMDEVLRGSDQSKF